MDATENLKGQLAAASAILEELRGRGLSQSPPEEAAVWRLCGLAEHLAKSVLALHDHLTTGGFIPHQWDH